MTEHRPAQAMAVSPITRCTCSRTHVTNATLARCWAAGVWFGWRREVVGDYSGSFALIVETHRPRRLVTVALFATTVDRDTARRFLEGRPDTYLYVSDVARPPP